MNWKQNQVLTINLTVLLLFGTSLLSSWAGFPYLQYLSGLALFFLPGLNLAYIVESFSKSQFGRGKLLLWVSLSPLIMGAVSYILILANKLSVNSLVVTIMGIVVALASGAAAIFLTWGKKHTKVFARFDKGNYYLLIGLLALITANLLIYRYIPETDSYGYIANTTQSLKESHFIFSVATRPIFYALLLSATVLTKIPIYWIFKILIPAAALFIALVYFLNARTRTNDRYVLILSTFALFSIPTLVMEIFIPRAQSVFMILLPVFCYLLMSALKQKERNYLEIVLLLLFSLAGIRIHEFFYFLAFLSFVSLAWFAWPDLKKNLARNISLGFVAIVLLYPWIRDFGVLEQIISFGQVFGRTLLHPTVDLWFIDNYTTVDGLKMGWPGISALFYYGYNVGPLIPLAVLAMVFVFKKIKSDLSWIPFLAFLLFFSIAEIFPRLGLAYLPDRVWPFIALMLLFYLPSILVVLPKNYFYKSLIVFLSAGYLLSLYLSYTKQGWTTPNEALAAQFIKDNTPENAAIITQLGNTPMVVYFSERTIINPTKEFFFDGDESYVRQYVSSVPEILSNKIKTEQELLANQAEIQDKIGNIFNPGQKDHDKLVADILKQFDKTNTLYQKLEQISESKSDQSRPVYILYSDDKFKTLYGQREWWNQANFRDADIAKFDKYFQKIYDKDGIYLWKTSVSK